MYQINGDKQIFLRSLNDAANYRPVSLTCNCMGSVVRGLETKLVQFVHDIISNLDGAVNRGHKQTDLILRDFAKAYDKVPHRKQIGILWD